MLSRTGHSLHRSQGRWQEREDLYIGRATAHTDQYHGAHLRGPRVACGRPLQVDLLPRALHTIHCWMHTHLESAGRQRGEQGERGGRGGGGALLLVRQGTNTHTGTGGRNAPPHSRHFPHRTPHMRSRTGDGLHQTQGRGQRAGEHGAWVHKSPHRPTNSQAAKTKTTCRSPSARVARGRPLVARAPAQTQQAHLCMPPEV